MIEEVHDDRSYSTATRVAARGHASTARRTRPRPRRWPRSPSCSARSATTRAAHTGPGAVLRARRPRRLARGDEAGLLEERDEATRLRRVTLLLRPPPRPGLADAAQERARRNGRVRTADELAAELRHRRPEALTRDRSPFRPLEASAGACSSYAEATYRKRRNASPASHLGPNTPSTTAAPSADPPSASLGVRPQMELFWGQTPRTGPSRKARGSRDLRGLCVFGSGQCVFGAAFIV